MSLIYPETRKKISDKMQVDIKNQLPSSDPFLRANFIFTLLIAYSDVIFDLYTTIKNLQNELFPDTATDDFAKRWAGFKGIIINAASKAEGLVTATGIAGTLIPANTLLQTSAGDQYETINDVTISSQSITTTLTRIGSVVTATTVSEHHFITGMSVPISGADQVEYDGVFLIVVTATNQFEYVIVGTPTTPATGTILSTVIFASLDVKSIGFGSEINLDGGTQLKFVTPIAGVDQNAYVQYEGIEGGTDEEDNTAFVERYLEAYRNPIAQFNKAQIIATCKEVAGVTRVFVFDATPQAGIVTVYFMRDNDLNPIPTSSEVNEVKNKLLTIKPVEMEDDDVIVNAPTPFIVNFVFTSLSPDSDNMRAEISANLNLFFKQSTSVGEDVPEDGYRSAIWQSIDSATGQRLNSFSLATPNGDITIATNEIGILGSITYP